MAKAVAEDSGEMWPACAWVDGEYGISGVYLGVQAELGATGVKKVVETPLAETELARCARPPRPFGPSRPTSRTSSPHNRTLTPLLRTVCPYERTSGESAYAVRSYC